MKLNFTDFRRKCQFPLILALAGVPVEVIIAANVAPECLHLWWVIPAIYAVLSWLCFVIPGRKRVLAGVLSAVTLLGLGIGLLPVKEYWQLLLGPAMYAIVLLWSLKIAGWAQGEEMHMAWYTAGLVTHAFLQVMINASHATGKLVYAPVEGIMIVCFLVYLLLMLLSLNRSSMDSASMGRQRIPIHMRRRNIALTIGFLILVVLVSAAPAVIEAVERAWDFLMMVIMKILDFIAQFLPESSPGGGGGGGMEFVGAGEATEQSLLSKIMERIAIVVTTIIAVALFAWAMKVLYKKLKILLNYLWKKLNEYASSASEDYEDEITDTREEGQRERINVLDRIKKRLTFVDEKKLAPAERIRYRYLRLMVKHDEWSAGQTARESLPKESAQLYEQARYSNHPVTEEDAEKFVSGIKNV